MINGVPFLNQVLDSLTQEQLGDLRDCINGEGGAPVFRTLGPGSNQLTSSDKGIKPLTLELSDLRAQNVYNGYLVYTDDYCVLIAYSSMKAQQLTLIDINIAKRTYTIKNCVVTVDALRSELDDVMDVDVSSLSNDVNKAIADGTIDISDSVKEIVKNLNVKDLFEITDLTDQEQLAQAFGKAFIYGERIYIPTTVDYSDSGYEYVDYFTILGADDGLGGISIVFGWFSHDLEEQTYLFETYYYDGSDLAGTKLYQHEITFPGSTVGDSHVTLPIYVISSTWAAPFTLNVGSIIQGNNGIISIGADSNPDNAYLGNINFVDNGDDTYSIDLDNGTTLAEDVTTIVDNVTEL